jgi:nucleoside-diphosphate-sugar epimerase
MKIVYISGADGMIGSALSVRFLQEGFSVVALVRNSLNVSRLPKDNHSLLVRNFDDLSLNEFISKNPGAAFFHLASPYFKSETQESLSAYVECHLQSAVLVTDMLIQSGCRFLLTTSSFYQYDCSSGAVDADTPLNLTSYYSATKQAFSDYICWYKHLSNISVLNIILPSVFGADKSSKFINLLVRANLLCEDQVFSGGSEKWDFLFLDDVVDALFKSYITGTESDEGVSGTYSIGSGETHSMIELNKYLSHITKCGSISFDGSDIGYIKYFQANSDIFNKRFSWIPSHTFFQAIDKVIKYEQKNRN